MLKSTMGKGFLMSFENGLTASVQWGPGNSCSNYSKDFEYHAGRFMMIDGECKNAEVAVWDTKTGKDLHAGDFLNDPDAVDNVLGWLSADEVADFLMAVKNYHPEET